MRSAEVGDQRSLDVGECQHEIEERLHEDYM